MIRAYCNTEQTKENRHYEGLKKYKSNFEGDKYNLIFNATGRVVNIIKGRMLINNGRVKTLLDEKLNYTNEIYPNAHFCFDEGKEERIFGTDLKIHLENVDFDFDRMTNEEADKYEIIIVDRAFADNIKNVIDRIILEYGADSIEMRKFLLENQFLDKLYVEQDVVINCSNFVIGCSKLKKAFLIIQDLIEMSCYDEEEEYLKARELLQLRKDMVSKEIRNIRYWEMCLKKLNGEDFSADSYDSYFEDWDYDFEG